MTALDALVEPCPGPLALSTTTTERPVLASSKAIEAPITPAPTTTTSAFTLMHPVSRRAGGRPIDACRGLPSRGSSPAEKALQACELEPEVQVEAHAAGVDGHARDLLDAPEAVVQGRAVHLEPCDRLPRVAPLVEPGLQ